MTPSSRGLSKGVTLSEPRHEATRIIVRENFSWQDSVNSTFTRWGFAKAHSEVCTEQEIRDEQERAAYGSSTRPGRNDRAMAM